MKKTEKTRQVNASGNIENDEKAVKTPPKETWWKPGVSANPRGRPSTGVFSQAAKRILAEYDPKLRKTGAERLMEQCYRRALQGSYKFTELFLAYTEGRPKQSLDLKQETTLSLEEADKIIAEYLDCTSNAPVLDQPNQGLTSSYESTMNDGDHDKSKEIN